MCGIIGYIGGNVESNLYLGLERLEYRGYDSSGMVIKRGSNFTTYKATGVVEKLKPTIKEVATFGIGLAHTRWATHGGISIENCHPHFSSCGDTALVHNGIIENYEELKGDLIKKGKYFYGQTDSEVIAKLFDCKLNINNLRRVREKLIGSYALAIISKNSDYIYFAKNKSPLYIGLGNDCALIASDPSCFVGFADSYITLEDGDYGKFSKKEVIIYDKNNKIIKKQPEKLDFSFINEELSGYSHFMLKEIYQSRIALEKIIEVYQSYAMKEKLEILKNKEFDRIYLIGCGTAYHAGLIGESYMRDAFNIDVFCEIASEIIYKNLNIDEKSLCIFISQSGETADTLSALEYCKNRGGIVVSITNTEYSSIAHKAILNFPILAGQEKAVASTKAYFAQCIVLYIITNYLKGIDYIFPLQNFKRQIDFGDDNILKSLASKLANFEKVFFIGRKRDYITAKEASLKLKEITYIFSSAEPSGELKHGVIALIDKTVPVIVIATDEKVFNKTLNNACEIKARGGKLILFTTLNIDNETEKAFDFVVKVNKVSQAFMPLQIILSLQKLAYFTAVAKGLDPDKPRNLAKSVTVE